MELVNAADVNRRLGNVIPNLSDDLEEASRDIAADLVTGTRATLAGVFSQRAASGLRAVAGSEPAVEWGGGVVFSGGGSIDQLWPAAEWGSSVYPHLPPRREGGHLFTVIDQGEQQRLDTWTAAAVKSLRATVH